MLVRILALAGAYYLIGQLSLLLAIPPGYATAFWPASGIALAGILLFGYRVWPGVVLGSFLINVPTTFDAHDAAATFLSLALPLGIGAGSTLQAVAAAALVRRYVGFPNPLNQEQAVATLLLLAGPASCLIGATVGVGLLWGTHRIQAQELTFNWWTWWVGDTIGVFLATPIALVWTTLPRPDWPRRPITISAPLGILAVLVVLLFGYTSSREVERVRLGFELQTEILTRILENRLDNALEALNSMHSIPDNHPTATSQRKFTRAAQSILDRRDSVQALTWISRVPQADRDAFEKAARSENMPGYAISELDAQRKRVPAGQRREYFPILYRQPLPPDGKALGFDVASDPVRLESLRRAADTGEAIATTAIDSADKDSAKKTIIVFLPIYRDGLLPDSITERREALVGYVAAVMRVRPLVEKAWQGFRGEGIDIWLFDETAAKRFVIFRGADAAWEVLPDSPQRNRPASVFQRSTSIDLMGRHWTLRFALTPAYLAEHRSMQPWSVLIGGMLFTGLLGAVLLVITGRAALVAALVKERTAELDRSNAALKQEVADRLRAEAELRHSQQQSRLVIETAADAFISMDAAGIVTAWNRQAEVAFGWSRQEAVGRRLIDTVLPQAQRPAFTRSLERFLTTREDTTHFQPIEIAALHRDGHEFPAEFTLWPVQTDSTFHFNAFIRDISERKRAQATLDESRRFIERVAAMTPNVLYVYDLNLKCNIFINQRIQSILGYPPEETMRPGTTFFRDHCHPDDWPKAEWTQEQLLTVDDDRVIESEFRIQHANGEWRWLHRRDTIFVRDCEGNPVQILGAAQDVTERKRLELEVVEVAAAEQRRIGQELHDGTGQELTGLTMLADNLADTLHDLSPAEEQKARRIALELRAALSRVRSLSRGLIPVEVDAEGLMAGLTELAKHIDELNVVRCVFDCHEAVPMEDNYTATQLYRIAQEAITNVLKHGQASLIRLGLEARGKYITLSIIDDGIGIQPAAATETGMGLRIMRYRASQIGAHLTIHPGPSNGTVVSCTLFRGTASD